MLTIAKILVEREIVKQQRANLIAAWSSSTVIEARNRFHCNFKAGM
jgi:hypothetical protein